MMPSALLTPKALGQAIRRERRTLGLTQEDLAKSTGYRRQTIVDLEAGRNASLQTLFATLSALGKGLGIEDPRPSIERLSSLRDPVDADEG
jgi:transcriptional regulator with XRE-family HTH domain